MSIGEATAALLKKEGASIIYTPSKSLAKVLAVELPAVARDKKKTRVLYPASKKAQSTLEDGLTSRGFEVMRLNTYDTVPAEWSEEEQVIKSIKACVSLLVYIRLIYYVSLFYLASA